MLWHSRNKKDRLSSFREFLENRPKILPWIKEYSPYELVTSDDPPVYLHYGDAPALGKNAKDPTHTANFGVKLQEKMRATGVECHLMCSGAAETDYPNPVELLIANLKAPRK